MSDEVKWVYASQVTLEDSGAEAATTVFVAADDADLAVANHYDYPYADFVLAAAFGSAVGAYSRVNLYRRDLNIDSTNDAPAPATTNKNLFVGAFVIPTGATTTDYYPLNNVPLSKDCEFYLENLSDQTMSSGWDLKATPKTYMPTA